MAKSTDRIVYRRSPGEWVEKATSSNRAASIHGTQAGAVDAAHATLERGGGGELITKGVDGRIRSKGTISPGNEVPKNKKH